jgi:hypothetical protein
MPVTEKEKEWAGRATRYLKAELKRADVTYAELAKRLNDHGLEETEDSITSKLGRGTFSATFLFACLTVLGIAALTLADL